MKTIAAYSPSTDTEYDSWDDLLSAEANGYVVVGITEMPNSAPWCVGPFDTKDEARKMASRMRRELKKLDAGTDRKSTVNVRALWRTL